MTRNIRPDIFLDKAKAIAIHATSFLYSTGQLGLIALKTPADMLMDSIFYSPIKLVNVAVAFTLSKSLDAYHYLQGEKIKLTNQESCITSHSTQAIKEHDFYNTNSEKAHSIKDFFYEHLDELKLGATFSATCMKFIPSFCLDQLEYYESYLKIGNIRLEKGTMVEKIFSVYEDVHMGAHIADAFFIPYYDTIYLKKDPQEQVIEIVEDITKHYKFCEEFYSNTSYYLTEGIKYFSNGVSFWVMGDSSYHTDL